MAVVLDSAMDAPSAISKQIEHTLSGPMWHGSALNELLDGVTFEQAATRPIPGAHTIWELVLHVSAWAEIARQRLHNRALESPPPDVDWPLVPTYSRPRFTSMVGADHTPDPDGPHDSPVWCAASGIM